MEPININAEALRVLSAPSHDAWAQLGLARDASRAEVKARYKRLCQLHPDKNLGNDLAARAFALVIAAFTACSASPLHSSQPEAQPHANRWQAFTGVSLLQQQQQQQQQQDEAPAVFQNANGGSSQTENRTPPTERAAAAGGGGTWQASKWGTYGGSSLLRAQPVAAAAAPTAVLAPEQASTHKQDRHWQPAPAPKVERRANGSSPTCDSASGSSDEDDGALATIMKPSAAGLQPAAFYGSSGKRGTPQAPPAAAASLYGLFGGRRSSGGQAASWLGARHSEHHSQPLVPGPAAATQQYTAPQAGNRWAGKGKLLAELLRQPSLMAAPAPAGAVGGGPPAREQPQQGSGAGDGRRKRQLKEGVVLSTSTSASSSDEEEETSASSGDELPEGAWGRSCMGQAGSEWLGTAASEAERNSHRIGADHARMLLAAARLC